MKKIELTYNERLQLLYAVSSKIEELNRIINSLDDDDGAAASFLRNKCFLLNSVYSKLGGSI